MILGLLWDNFGTNLDSWGPLGPSWGPLGPSWGPLGGSGGSQERPKSSQRAPKELPERSKSVQNRSGRLRERPRSQKGCKNGEFWGHLGVNFGVILGSEKRPRKKKVEKVKIELSCTRQHDFGGSKGSEN